MNKPQEPSKTPQETEAELLKAQKQNEAIYRSLKRRLKLLSKRDLINIAITYGSDLQDQQELNRFLYEENKQLKAQLQELKND